MRPCDHEIQIAPRLKPVLPSPPSDHGLHCDPDFLVGVWGSRLHLRPGFHLAATLADAPSASRRLQHGIRDRVSEAEMTDGKPAGGQGPAPNPRLAQRWDGRSTGFVSQTASMNNN